MGWALRFTKAVAPEKSNLLKNYFSVEKYFHVPELVKRGISAALSGSAAEQILCGCFRAKNGFVSAIRSAA